MRVDLDFYGSAAMDEVGAGPPDPRDRRVTNDQVVDAYGNLCTWAREADGLGFDTMWLTEHHFQHEGYELTPNLVLFGLHLAGLTERLRFGQMFNVVPQWHPLRLAEDFAMADVLSGGRMVFGVGRGTVPREAQTLGTVVASGDNAMSRDADRVNREVFEEAMEVILSAWASERFSFSGKHFTFPPPGIPDRGSTVTTLTLVPRPTRTPEVFQPVTSPATLEYVASKGFHGVFANAAPSIARQRWDEFAEASERAGLPLAPGERRCLQMIVHAAPTTGDAIRVAGPGHDEYVKFLSPYGRLRWMAEDAEFSHRPTLDETRAGGVWAIGSVEEVADCLGRWTELLDLRHLVLFPELPGLGRERVAEQLHVLAEEVLPRLGVTLAGP